MSVDHYENFPVASLLMPKSIRQDVIHLYRFARAADDVADEGDVAPADRLMRLRQFRQALHEIAETGTYSSNEDPELSAIFAPLADTVRRHQLPLTLLNDLLLAFEQDISVKRYATSTALDQYCQRSANPVGRLMLHLFGRTDEQRLQQSDAICTALQRINFLQDVAIDFGKGRIYLPQQDLDAADVSIEQIERGIVDDRWISLMSGQASLCRELLHFGQPLGRGLGGRTGLEIRLIVQGGLRVLEKLEIVRFDVFRHRPVLLRTDWVRMFWRAL